MLIPGEEFSLYDDLIEEAKSIGCFYCRYPIEDSHFPVVCWRPTNAKRLVAEDGSIRSGNIYLHDGCAQGLAIHLLNDGYRTHDVHGIQVHNNGSGPDGCVTCELQSNVHATGQRRPGGSPFD
jgi:hypothetical protein